MISSDPVESALEVLRRYVLDGEGSDERAASALDVIARSSLLRPGDFLLGVHAMIENDMPEWYRDAPYSEHAIGAFSVLRRLRQLAVEWPQGFRPSYLGDYVPGQRVIVTGDEGVQSVCQVRRVCEWAVLVQRYLNKDGDEASGDLVGVIDHRDIRADPGDE